MRRPSIIQIPHADSYRRIRPRRPENRFITQTNINICVKNDKSNGIFFDESPDFRHEDEKYCCDILRRKMKIGYCKTANTATTAATRTA